MRLWKRCTKCKKLRWMRHYYPDKRRRDGKQSHCKYCFSVYSKEYKQRDDVKKRLAEYARTWRKRSPEYCKRNNERSIAWAKTKKGIEYRREYQKRPKVRERKNALRRKWSKDPKYALYWSSREYRKRPDVLARQRIRLQNRRAKKREVKGVITGELITELFKHYGNHCLCCGSFEQVQVDHVISIKNGGTHDISNIQPLCKGCNSSKQARHNTDYRPDKGDYALQLRQKQMEQTEGEAS